MIFGMAAKDRVSCCLKMNTTIAPDHSSPCRDMPRLVKTTPPFCLRRSAGVKPDFLSRHRSRVATRNPTHPTTSQPNEASLLHNGQEACESMQLFRMIADLMLRTPHSSFCSPQYLVLEVANKSWSVGWIQSSSIAWRRAIS